MHSCMPSESNESSNVEPDSGDDSSKSNDEINTAVELDVQDHASRESNEENDSTCLSSDTALWNIERDILRLQKIWLEKGLKIEYPFI